MAGRQVVEVVVLVGMSCGGSGGHRSGAAATENTFLYS